MVCVPTSFVGCAGAAICGHMDICAVRNDEFARLWRVCCELFFRIIMCSDDAEAVAQRRATTAASERLPLPHIRINAAAAGANVPSS